MRAVCGAWRSSSAGTGDSRNGLSTPALNALTVFYAQALAADGIKVNALAPGLRATGLNLRAASAGGDPAEAAAAAVPLALLPEDGPTGYLFSLDGTDAP
jgi:NAD(P)-dependent dehydrogenase (short-subunit alcohol dehydrogenase family)